MDLSLFEKLDQATAAALGSMNCPAPTTFEAKEEIRRRMFRTLRIKPEWIPDISWKTIKVKQFRNFTVETIRFRSWENMYGDASLYLPADHDKPLPVMLFSPGHAMVEGRFYGPYQTLSRLLAESGVAVLLFDQFGLGGRFVTGHKGNFDVFGCGTTVSGLMILEDTALFNALEKDSRFDRKRIGLIGHSGGGQNTIFLSAVLWDRAALSIPCGFACSYEYGARKMRHVCECNLFPGILHEFETWHALGCMNPKPLMVCSGINDPMIARDVVLNLKIRMQTVYQDNQNFEQYFWMDRTHDFSDDAYCHIADFILRHFGLPETGAVTPPLPPFPACPDPEVEPLPADCINIDILAERLTGVKAKGLKRLEDTFPAPSYLPEKVFSSLPAELQNIFIQNSIFL